MFYIKFSIVFLRRREADEIAFMQKLRHIHSIVHWGKGWLEINHRIRKYSRTQCKCYLVRFYKQGCGQVNITKEWLQFLNFENIMLSTFSYQFKMCFLQHNITFIFTFQRNSNQLTDWKRVSYFQNIVWKIKSFLKRLFTGVSYAKTPTKKNN